MFHFAEQNPTLLKELTLKALRSGTFEEIQGPYKIRKGPRGSRVLHPRSGEQLAQFHSK